MIKLHQAVQAVCPIDGVSIGKISDRSTWRVDFADAATEAQKAAALAVVASFVPPDEKKADDQTDHLVTALTAMAAHMAGMEQRLQQAEGVHRALAVEAAKRTA